MTKLRDRLAAGAVWYDDRPVRERTLILVTACVLVVLMGWELLVAPSLVERQQLNREIGTLSDNRDALISEQQSLQQQLATDPSAELRRRLDARRDRLARLDRQIAETTDQLIAPREMVALLRDMLAAQQGLELQSLELLSPQPVFETQPGEQDEDAQTAEPLLYAHDVELTIRGSYPDVQVYLEALESMDDRLGWLQLSYDAGNWPSGEATLRVRTLSLEAAWLGV
ncbi:MSHA biogenesis protein MshJ [Marinobacter oulmenensis]|uniref:MSHA biogenesis protein MshJ n=1 Tax=Marinobacter oulmenensis TaxID=643747 RepID=A0A840UAV9_9GAMM|nr:MSHA biogenesis protein MshJ [Marinobacter oulmenensis]MBB5322269.1 MSHA biogenesis protein MshJ [Marinobacter oulmenensis]